MLVAVLRPLHRAVEQPRRRGDGEGLAAPGGLKPEGTPHVLADQHLDPLQVQPERLGEPKAQGVPVLHVAVERKLAVGLVVVGDRAAGLHRHRRQPLRLEGPADHPVRRGERRVDVPEGLPVEGHRVAGQVVEQGRAHRVEGRLVGGDRGQRLVADVHQLGPVLSEVARLRDHHRDRVTDVPDPVGGQRVEHRGGHPRQPDRHGLDQVMDIRSCDDRGNPRQPARGRGIDRGDLGVRHGAADEGGVQHPGQLQVIDVAALPGEDPAVFDAVHPGAGEPHGVSAAFCVAMRSAASRTPATIDW